MASMSPLIVIVGTTASGKTALAIELAKKFHGEIICADSRTVYKGMDIGTAKPTKREQQGIPHHVLDVVEPDQTFTAADFRRLANEAIQDIANRGKLPILVGGTGLYINSVLYDFKFLPPVDKTERERLNKLSIPELQKHLNDQHIPLPTNQNNPRHLVRALETNGATGSKKPMRANTLVLGLQPGKEILEKRIHARIEAMVQAGFVDEVRKLMQSYSFDLDSLKTPGYKAFKDYIDGVISLEAAKERFAVSDRQLAKRQRTWFKRNKKIIWIETSEQATELVQALLNK